MGEAEFGRIFDGLVQMFVAVYQQIAGYFGVCAGQVEGQAVGFGVPVGGPAVLLTGKALGPNIQPLVDARKRLQEVENIETDALLRGIVALNN